MEITYLLGVTLAVHLFVAYTICDEVQLWRHTSITTKSVIQRIEHFKKERLSVI